MHCIETYKLFSSFPFACFLDPRRNYGILELHPQLTLSGSFVGFWSLSQAWWFYPQSGETPQNLSQSTPPVSEDTQSPGLLHSEVGKPPGMESRSRGGRIEETEGSPWHRDGQPLHSTLPLTCHALSEGSPAVASMSPSP